MGRKRKNIEYDRIVIQVPKEYKKELKNELEKVGVTFTQLFLESANKYLKK